MTFAWVDFLTLSERLNSHPDVPGPEEAALRTAVSRAYYAAFRSAMDWAQGEGFIPTFSGSDHKDVQAHFRNHTPSDAAHKTIALQLDRLYDDRRLADYESSLGRAPSSLAYQALSKARIVFTNLNSLKQP